MPGEPRVRGHPDRTAPVPPSRGERIAGASPTFGSRRRREPSERVEAALEQAELVPFGIGEDVPGLLPGLADVDGSGPGGQEAFQFGVLIAVGGVDVEVQPEDPVLRLVGAAEGDRRLRAAEPLARSYLDAVLVA